MACLTMNRFILTQCVQLFQKKVSEIVEKDSELQIERIQGHNILKSMTGNVGYAPSIERSFDGRSLPGFLDEPPAEVIRNGTFKKVPLLTGVTKDETANGFLLNELDDTFQSATKFLNSIAMKLSSDNQLLGNLTGKLLPGIGKLTTLTDYLTIPAGLDVTQILTKVVESIQ